MPKQRKTKTLRELKDIWYTKLAKTGFEDAEDAQGRLKTWHGSDFHERATPDQFQAKQDYFLMATEFLHWYKFKNKRERKIWEMHSEGANLREIGEKVGLTKNQVYPIVRKLRKEMQCPN